MGSNVYTLRNVDEIDDIRMILLPNTISKKGGYYVEYLCWIKPKDLEELDQRVLNDTYTDDDFEFAIKTGYKGSIMCFECNSKFDGFEVEGGNPYLGNKGLFKEKMELMQKNKANLNCPNCNSSLRITILKFIQ